MNAKVTNNLHLLPKLSVISFEVESTYYSENSQKQHKAKQIKQNKILSIHRK